MSRWPCEEVTLDLYNATPWYDVRLWIASDGTQVMSWWSDMIMRVCREAGSSACDICNAIADHGKAHGLNAVQVMAPRQVNPNGQLLARVDIGHMIYCVPFDA